MSLQLWLNNKPPSGININSETADDFLQQVQERRITIFTTAEMSQWGDIYLSWAKSINKSFEDPAQRRFAKKYLSEYRYRDMPDDGEDAIIYLEQEPEYLLRAILKEENRTEIIKNLEEFKDILHRISGSTDELTISDRYLLKCTDVLVVPGDDGNPAHVKDIPENEELSETINCLQLIIYSLPEQVRKLHIKSEMANQRDFIRIVKSWGSFSNSKAKELWPGWITHKNDSMESVAERICEKLESRRKGGLEIAIIDCTPTNWGEGLEHDRFIIPFQSCYISSAGFRNMPLEYDADAGEDMSSIKLSPPTYILSIGSKTDYLGTQNPVYKTRIYANGG